MIRPGRRDLVLALVAACLGFAVALPFFGQGLDMVDEGRWLLGARMLVEGEDLHARLADVGSGLREHALATWMQVAGPEASSLASLRSVGFALAIASMVLVAGSVGGTTAALAIGIAALAALPLAPGPTLAWIVVAWTAWSATRTARVGASGTGVGLALVLLLDPRAFLALVPAAVVFFAEVPSARRSAGWTAGGAVAVLVVAAVATALGQEPAIGFHEVFVAPLVHAVSTVDLSRAVQTAIDGAWLDRPFAGLRSTGESWSAAWPGHGSLRAAALRLFVVLAPLAVIAALAARARGTSRGVAGAALVTALTATWVLLLRGDVPSLRTVAPLLVLTVVLLAGRRATFALAAGLVCLPLASEPVWLALHRDRAGLERVAGASFAADRAERLRSVRTALDPRPGEAVLIWPELPGVHWILGTSPAARHLDVPTTPAADAATAAALERRRPRYVLLGFSRDLLGHALHRVAPRSWSVLHADYRLRGRVLGGDEDLRVMTPAVLAHAAESAGMANQLPMVELTVANDRSPALREDFGVGQGFRSGPRDVEGFAFRARTSGRDVSLRVQVQVWEKKGDRYHTLLESEEIETTIVADRQVVFIEFPVPDSANRDLGIVMEALETPGTEVRLDWRADDDPRDPGDLYPAGDALLALTPVDADLYFLVY